MGVQPDVAHSPNGAEAMLIFIVFSIPCVLFLASMILLRGWTGLKKAIVLNFLIVIVYALVYLPQTGMAPINFLSLLYLHSGIVFVVAIIKKVRHIRSLKHRAKTNCSASSDH
jgi:hypothetical protein